MNYYRLHGNDDVVNLHKFFSKMFHNCAIHNGSPNTKQQQMTKKKIKKADHKTY